MTNRKFELSTDIYNELTYMELENEPEVIFDNKKLSHPKPSR